MLKVHLLEYFSDAEVLFLDESTSNLDEETKAMILICY